MPDKPNFSAEFTSKQLENVRKVARQLDLVIPSGQRAGDGSPRQLMILIANAVEVQGVRKVAAALRDLLPDTEAKAD